MPGECVCLPVLRFAGICVLHCHRKVGMFIREVDSAILKCCFVFFFFMKMYLNISGLAPKPSLSNKTNIVSFGNRIFSST